MLAVCGLAAGTTRISLQFQEHAAHPLSTPLFLNDPYTADLCVAQMRLQASTCLNWSADTPIGMLLVITSRFPSLVISKGMLWTAVQLMQNRSMHILMSSTLRISKVWFET
jgi:hypothetical protein